MLQSYNILPVIHLLVVAHLFLKKCLVSRQPTKMPTLCARQDEDGKTGKENAEDMQDGLE